MKQWLIGVAIALALLAIGCRSSDDEADEIPETPPSPQACSFAGSTPLVFSSVTQVVTDVSTGTAFAIGDGEFLTAAHVIAGATEISLRIPSGSAPAETVGAELSTDIAILRSDLEGVEPASFGSVDAIAAGHSIGVAGYPVYVADEPSVVSGLLSKIVEDPDLGFGTFLQTDAAVNPGNSGGPMFNECGEVVGMVVIKISETTIEGISWGVAENTLRSSLVRVRRRGTDDLLALLPSTPTPSATPDAVSEAEAVAAAADFLLTVMSEYVTGDQEFVAIADGSADATLGADEAIDRLYALEGDFYDYAEEVGAPENSVAAVSTVCERTRQALVDALNAYGVAAGFTGVYLQESDDTALDEAESALAFSIERFDEARGYLEGCRAGE